MVSNRSLPLFQFTADHFKYLMKHRFREFTCLGVLLTGMVSRNDRLPVWKWINFPMSKSQGGNIESLLSQGPHGLS